jgi:hypothetical protein
MRYSANYIIRLNERPPSSIGLGEEDCLVGNLANPDSSRLDYFTHTSIVYL